MGGMGRVGASGLVVSPMGCRWGVGVSEGLEGGGGTNGLQGLVVGAKSGRGRDLKVAHQ